MNGHRTGYDCADCITARKCGMEEALDLIRELKAAMYEIKPYAMSAHSMSARFAEMHNAALVKSVRAIDAADDFLAKYAGEQK